MDWSPYDLTGIFGILQPQCCCHSFLPPLEQVETGVTLPPGTINRCRNSYRRPAGLQARRWRECSAGLVNGPRQPTGRELFLYELEGIRAALDSEWIGAQLSCVCIPNQAGSLVTEEIPVNPEQTPA